jgi:hypothetical protein
VQERLDLLCRFLEETHPGMDRPAHAGVAGAPVVGRQPRTVEPVVARGGAEVPDVRLAVAGQQTVADQLVTRPFPDDRGRDVADVVLVEDEKRAQARCRERLARARQAVLVQRRKSTRSSKSTCMRPGACSGRSQRWPGSGCSIIASCKRRSAARAASRRCLPALTSPRVLLFFFAMSSPGSGVALVESRQRPLGNAHGPQARACRAPARSRDRGRCPRLPTSDSDPIPRIPRP